MGSDARRCVGGCSLRMGRRGFLTLSGAAALGLQTRFFDFGSALFAEESEGPAKPRIRALFVRPGKEEYWMSWPGAAYNPEACQAEYTKVLAEAAGKLGVQLDVSPVPLQSAESLGGALAQLKQSPPDGLIITMMHLRYWPQVTHLLQNRGPVPTVVFSPLGTALAGQTVAQRLPKTFVAMTHDGGWLASGLRMLKTAFDLSKARICLITDAAKGDQRIEPVGTTLHFVPLARWDEELKNTAVSDEVTEIAKQYAIGAKDIVEPDKEDMLRAAKGYVAARAIMAAEKCQGISLDCGHWLDSRKPQCGTCLAWSRLQDEGLVGTCEADGDAAVSMLLSMRLLDRPGFIQDPAPNTVNNTLIASHCTCATKLQGYDKPPASFVLRSHAETNRGVAFSVAWNPGEAVTIMKFQRPDMMVLGTGHVVDNVPASSPGGCRTAVEIAVDEVADTREIRGNHQLVIAGRWDRPLKAFCELSGLRTVHI